MVIVDGGWSSWSEWEPCMQDGTTQTLYGDDKPDMCMCRLRRCDNPKPVNGGQACKGKLLFLVHVDKLIEELVYQTFYLIFIRHAVYFETVMLLVFI